MAVRLAATTSRIRLVTAVVVLPLHDPRMLAGEVIQADILCEGRLVLGVGRGAFGYEMGRLGVPIETSRERFAETAADPARAARRRGGGLGRRLTTSSSR